MEMEIDLVFLSQIGFKFFAKIIEIKGFKNQKNRFRD
jgi:hypothetical protein